MKMFKENKNANTPGGVTMSHTAALCRCRGSSATGLSSPWDANRCKIYVTQHRFGSYAFLWHFLPPKNVYRHRSKKHVLKKQLGWQPSYPLGEMREKQGRGGTLTVKFKDKV